MSKRKTHEEYVAQVFKVNPNIKVVGEYINASTKILHRCRIDKNEWYATPNNILSGHGCRKCFDRLNSQKRYKTHEQYLVELYNINANIIPIEDYKGDSVKIKHMCLVDGYIWEVAPTNLLRGVGCPRCSKKERYTTDSFKEKMNIINNNIEIIGEYINEKTKILCRCKIDGHEWHALPSNLIKGKGCPVCNMSHGERIIKSYLIDKKIKYNPQYTFDDCRSIYKLEFDFYLPEYQYCIEYDGVQHFEPIEHFGGQTALEERIKRDMIKTNYCKENNIPLLRIRYDEDIIKALDNFFNNTKLLEEAV